MLASVTLQVDEIPQSATPTVAGASRSDVSVDRELEVFLKGVEARAYRLAELSLRHADDALDVVQDAMLQLVRHYAGRPSAEWAPLFYRILRNRIRDAQRRRRTRNRLIPWWTGGISEGEGVVDPVDTAVCDGATPPESLADAQALDAILKAVSHLPERQREAFLLRTLEGLDVAATAHAMGCSQGSVKTHYFRALTHLRKELGGHQS